MTFAQFAEIYLRDHADLHKRSADRDREILKVLNRAFGSLILHEITATGSSSSSGNGWRGSGAAHGRSRAPKPIKPGTVNRELDTLQVDPGQGRRVAEAARLAGARIKRLKVDNRRTRILTEDEQRARCSTAAPGRCGR